MTTLNGPSAHSKSSIIRWRDLYRISAIASGVFILAIIFAVVAFLIWPYTPGVESVENILTTLQSNRWAGLISLDSLMIILMPIMIIPMLGIYVALKGVNESYALIALILGLMGNTIIFAGRPVLEMVHLSELYAGAANDLARSHYLALGEVLLSFFDGTVWLASMYLVGISGIISSLVMIKSQIFPKTTAYVGVVISIIGLGVIIPRIGPMLSLLATVGGVWWYLLLGRTFFQLGWK